MTNFEPWLRTIAHGDSDRQIATKAGIPTATFSRQLTGDAVSAENAVAIARAYKASPVRALVSLGLLEAADVDVPGIKEALREASDKQLVDEVMERLAGTAEGTTVFDTPAPIPLRPDVATVKQDGAPLGAVAKRKSRDRGGEEGKG